MTGVEALLAVLEDDDAGVVPGDEILAWSVIAAVGLVTLGFLIGALRRRSEQGAIARMAVDLDQGADPDQVRAALRHALGDPTLELYLRDGERGWLTSYGRVANIPRHAERASTVLESADGPLVVVTHDPILREDPGLVAAAVAVLRLAIENERLGQVVRDQLDEVRASRARLIQAAEDERQRIVRDLHDGAQQRLIAVALSLQQARQTAQEGPTGPGGLRSFGDGGPARRPVWLAGGRQSRRWRDPAAGRDPARVIVADDSAVIRAGVAPILGDPGLRVVAEAATADEALESVEKHRPDLAVLDIRMPPSGTPGCSRPRASAINTADRQRCWCSPSTSNPSTHSACSVQVQAASAICSKSASPSPTSLSTPPGASLLEARRSTRP